MEENPLKIMIEEINMKPYIHVTMLYHRHLMIAIEMSDGCIHKVQSNKIIIPDPSQALRNRLLQRIIISRLEHLDKRIA